MAKIIRIASLGAFACLATGASAAPESAFHQAAFGSDKLDKGSVCFARAYDAAHLSAHPGQRIRDVAIKLTIRRENGERRIDHSVVAHLVGSKQKWWSGGQCHEFNGLAASCYVEGDGGSMHLTLSPDGKAATARFDTLRIWRPQDASDESTMTIDKSPEDKVAKLARASAAACAGAGD